MSRRPAGAACFEGSNERIAGTMYWLILLAATAFAQDTGSVRGVVTSISGEPLRKALVQLQSMPAKFDGSVLQTTTDSAGAFAFKAVPAGNYVATARRNGY